MDDNDLHKRCLKWMDDTQAEIALGCVPGSWYWCVPVEPPEQLQEAIDELAEDAITNRDGDPTCTVRGWLGDPEYSEEKEDEQ